MKIPIRRQANPWRATGVIALAMLFLTSCAAYGIEQAPPIPQAPPICDEAIVPVQCRSGSCSPGVSTKVRQAPKTSCASGACGNTKAAPRANTIVIQSRNGTLEMRSAAPMDVSMKAKQNRRGPIRRMLGKC